MSWYILDLRDPRIEMRVWRVEAKIISSMTSKLDSIRGKIFQSACSWPRLNLGLGVPITYVPTCMIVHWFKLFVMICAALSDTVLC